jgi:subtilisin family serine protease
MVSHGWFHVHLNRTQFRVLTDSTNFRVFPIRPVIGDHRGSFLVVAAKSWRDQPRVHRTAYVVHNLTAVSALRMDPAVLAAIPLPTKKLRNRYTSGFIQSGLQKNVYHQTSGHYGTFRSLHEVGLNGSGQVINIVDTGIDVENIFFADGRFPLSNITNRTEFRHRKIVRIDALADNLDYTIGHGTHVCGIAAGYANCSWSCGASQYNGIAIGAKLHVTDLGFAVRPGDLSADVDLDEQAVIMRGLGAHVSSNSWSYDYAIPEVRWLYDTLAYENQDILYVFAAGNTGQFDGITSPSDAKNVLTVASSEQPSGSMAELGENQRKVFVVGENTSELAVGMNSLVWARGLENPLRYLVDRGAVQAGENATGQVVLLDDGDCATLKQLENDGAVAVVVAGRATSCAVSLPVITGVSLDPGQISILPFPGDDGGPLEIARTSSRGPVETGIRKPDITIPGEFVRSAYSHGFANIRPYDAEAVDEAVIAMSGTSMAAPGAAGAAAIICQFLQEKWYPHFASGTGIVIPVSSALIRAILAAATDKGHDIEGGFGIPNLSSVLTFRGYGLRIVGGHQIESAAHHVFRLIVESGKWDLVVTMAYVDAPLSHESANPLYADLDLVIVDPVGDVQFGNGRQDEFATVEKVIIPRAAVIPGAYEIHVFASEFPAFETVNYALVVRGPFQHFNFSQNAADLQPDVVSDCLPGAVQTPSGQCACDSGWTGHDCQTPVAIVNATDVLSIRLVHGVVQYIDVVGFPAAGVGLALALTRLRGNASPNLYLCTSEFNATSIASAAWSCARARLGENPIEALGVALFLGSAEAVTLELRVHRTPPVVPDESGAAGLVVVAFAAAALLVLAVYAAYRLRLRSPDPEAQPQSEVDVVDNVRLAVLEADMLSRRPTKAGR